MSVHEAKTRRYQDEFRARDEARRRLDAEEHARTWVPPVPTTLKVLLETPDTETPWRFDGLLQQGHNALIVAPRKAGKTTLVNNVIRSYVDGGPFLGCFTVTTTGRSVAVFNYELTARQYRRWLCEAGIQATDRVHVLNLRGVGTPLVSPHVRRWVTGWLRDNDIGAWLPDPYARAYVGSVENENDGGQVGRFLDTLDQIKTDAGVDELIMPVHSTSKTKAEPGAETALGSSRLEGWADSFWFITRDDQNRWLRAEGRDVDQPESPLKYDSATRLLTLDRFGSNRLQAKADADVAALLTYLGEHPGETATEVLAGLGWGRHTERLARARQLAGPLINVTPGARGAMRHALANGAPALTPQSQHSPRCPNWGSSIDGCSCASGTSVPSVPGGPL